LPTPMEESIPICRSCAAPILRDETRWTDDASGEIWHLRCRDETGSTDGRNFVFTQTQVWDAIDQLARRQDCSLSRLAVRAGLDATALNRSKRTGPDGKPRWPSTETISKLLSATGTTLMQFSQLVEGHLHCARREHSRDILLVDDDAAFCDASAQSLRHAGYRVHVASARRAALHLVDSDQPIDLLCTDFAMPDGLDGPALARRAIAGRPALKVLYITGHGIPGLETARGTGILCKPFSTQALLDAVERRFAASDPAGADAPAAASGRDGQRRQT